MSNRIRLTPKRIRASYEGAATGRRAAGWDAPDGAINAIAIPALPALRKRSRAAVRNDPYAYSAIDKRVSSIIGTGITPRASIEDAELRRTLRLLWEDWVDESDADGITDFYGQQALIARMVEESGECFVRLRKRRAAGRPRWARRCAARRWPARGSACCSWRWPWSGRRGGGRTSSTRRAGQGR